MCSDVQRRSKMFSDDHRCSWIFSRCSLDVLLMFKGKETYLRKCIFSSVSIGPRTKNQWGAMFTSKISYLWNGLAYVCWINHCHETQDQILWAQLAQLLNYQMTSTSFLCTEEYTVRRGQSCQFSFWLMKITKLQGWEKVFSYLPSFGPNRQTQNNQF